MVQCAAEIAAGETTREAGEPPTSMPAAAGGREAALDTALEAATPRGEESAVLGDEGAPTAPARSRASPTPSTALSSLVSSSTRIS